jgi:hypothetical protein
LVTIRSLIFPNGALIFSTIAGSDSAGLSIRWDPDVDFELFGFPRGFVFGNLRLRNDYFLLRFGTREWTLLIGDCLRLSYRRRVFRLFNFGFRSHCRSSGVGDLFGNRCRLVRLRHGDSSRLLRPAIHIQPRLKFSAASGLSPSPRQPVQ